MKTNYVCNILWNQFLLPCLHLALCHHYAEKLREGLVSREGLLVAVVGSTGPGVDALVQELINLGLSSS